MTEAGGSGPSGHHGPVVGLEGLDVEVGTGEVIGCPGHANRLLLGLLRHTWDPACRGPGIPA